MAEHEEDTLLDLERRDPETLSDEELFELQSKLMQRFIAIRGGAVGSISFSYRTNIFSKKYLVKPDGQIEPMEVITDSGDKFYVLHFAPFGLDTESGASKLDNMILGIADLIILLQQLALMPEGDKRKPKYLIGSTNHTMAKIAIKRLGFLEALPSRIESLSDTLQAVFAIMHHEEPQDSERIFVAYEDLAQKIPEMQEVLDTLFHRAKVEDDARKEYVRNLRLKSVQSLQKSFEMLRARAAAELLEGGY